MPRIANSTGFGMKYCTGVSTAAGSTTRPDESQRPSRVLAVEPVVVAADERQRRGARRRPPTVPTSPRSNAPSPYSSSRKRLASTGAVNSPNPIAAKARMTSFGGCGSACSRANAASIEIGAGFVVLDHLAEDVLLLELTAWRLREAERDEAERCDRDAEDAGRPTATRRRRRPAAAMPPTSSGLTTRTIPRGAVRVAPIRPRTVIGYVSASIEPCTVRLFDLATPAPNCVPEQHERVDREAGEERHEREREARPADDRTSPVAVGEPPHRQRAEHDERTRGRADEDDRAAADAEGISDVGREHTERGARQFVERHDREQHRKHPHAAALQTLPQRHRLVADTGKLGIGQDDLLAALRLRGLTECLLREHRGRQRRRRLGTTECRAFSHRSPMCPVERGPSRPRGLLAPDVRR